MTDEELCKVLAVAYDAAPKMDVHTHLWWRTPAAKDAKNVVFYHMMAAEWHAAGMAGRVPDHRSEAWGEPHDWPALFAAAGAVAPQAGNTALARALLAIGRDLYGVTHRQLDAQFFAALDAAMCTRGDAAAWTEQIFDRMNLKRVLTSHCGGRTDLEEFPQRPHPRMALAYERDFALPPKYAQHIIARIEARYGYRLKDLDGAIEWFNRDMAAAYAAGARVQVKWPAQGELPLTLDKDRAAAAVRKALAGEDPDREESRALAAFMFAQRLDFARTHGQTFQICSMSTYVTRETYTLPLTSEAFLRSLAAWIDRTPDVAFDILNCDPVTEAFFMTLARTRPNVYLCGVWWHAMSDAWIEEMFYRRLLTVPLCKLTGFFSDAYCAEWVYGKHVLMKAGIVRALARAVRAGVFSVEDCPAVLQQILHDTPARLCGERSQNTETRA